jgi:antitoxin (DNA-binding transcriptional repressor) of toxin-antitoxin stability system
MKTISIKQLHAETGRWVRAASKQPIIVTDRGAKIATIQPHDDPARPRAVLDPVRRLRWMPVTPADSTVFISEDRDGR